MSQTAEQVAKLARRFLDMDREPDFDKDFGEANVSSMDAIAFAKALAQEFEVEIPAEDFADFKNLGHICNYLDEKTG